MTYTEFANKWLNPPNQRVDYDHVFEFQCVDLVLEYLYECFQINGAYGNAIDFWTNPDPKILTRLHKVDGSDVLQGDIVVLNGLSGNSFGHIGIATGNLNSQDIEILEQNGQTGDGSGQAGNAIRTRYVPRNRVAGLLRANSDTPPTPLEPTYTVTETYDNGKQVKLNKQPTYLWGMNYHFDYMKDHPVETHNQGEIWTITNKVHHEDGYDYYRREGQVDGFNVLDCDDYTPPPPPAPPTGAVPFPGNGEKFTAVVPLRGYQSGTQAGNQGDNFTTTLEPGDYYVYRYYPNRQDLVNVTTDKSKPGAWIWTAENVLPAPPPPEPNTYINPRSASMPTPVIAAAIPDLEPEPVHEPTAPTDWKASYVPFNPGTGDGNITTPREYQVNLPGRLWNLDETGPEVTVFISKNQRLHAYGTVTKPDEHGNPVKYYRLKTKRDVNFDWWLCAPITFDHKAVLTLPGPSWMDRVFHRGEQLKSIFTEGEPKFIDSIQLNPFHKKKK